jgi:hypothetical protein
MELEGEMGGVVLEKDTNKRKLGREKSRNPRTVRPDGIYIFVICGVYRKFEP